MKDNNICTYCNDEIRNQDNIVRCSKCNYIFHSDCINQCDDCENMVCDDCSNNCEGCDCTLCDKCAENGVCSCCEWGEEE